MAKKERLSNLNIDDLLAETANMLKSLEKKTCRQCKKQKKIYESGFCEECWLEKQAAREEKLANARHVDGKYVRVYRDGKLVYEHKAIMEEYLGRPLNERETVGHKDGDSLNNSLSNLFLSMKSGTPFEWIVCTNCQCRGSIEIVPLPDELPPVGP